MNEKRRCECSLIFLFIPCVFLVGCIEELELERLDTNDFDDVLVVEAVLTNEMKKQRVLLSRATNRLDIITDTIYDPATPINYNKGVGVDTEENASVMILDELGNKFDFEEVVSGTYMSLQPFQAELGKNYHLEITTKDGEQYISNEMSIAGISQITDLYAERIINDLGEEGMSIYINSEEVQGDSQFYRYTYEESYKIIAPNWAPMDFKLSNYEPCALPVPTYDLEIIPREEEERVCYNTVDSNTIIQNSTVELSENKVLRFPIRFINRNDYILTYRYSILAKQFVQSAPAYSYYNRLEKFSQTGSLFSQIQPGLLNGNIVNKNDLGDNVLGYFEVASVTERRLFFNYEDFFPNEPLPPYVFNCDNLLSAPESHVSFCFSGLSMNSCPQSVIERVNMDLISYVSDNDIGLGACPGPHIFTPNICGDCTTLGSNVVPEFWIEE
ncbi:hypothetical protein GGR42_000552 [Saonia flava]|uniref:DUF4249 domain-containing protein n=1 Tax=Saonia flava TaxID=523696 RepID=A0A846QT02_9FLAO|nr:DUF4249 domain-containing protein [Saonia flava]NJB70090.1 hypothetical protein [Saonia flava]